MTAARKEAARLEREQDPKLLRKQAREKKERDLYVARIAYLVLARGTGRDNRTTVWSAHAVENNTTIPWRMAKAAVQAVVDAGLVRRDRGGSRPKYYLLPAHEIAGCEGGPVSLSKTERALVDMMSKEPLRVPKTAGYRTEWPSTKPYDIAIDLVRRPE